MSYGQPDPYHQPEHFDLRIIGEIDDPQSSYSFNMVVVWRHRDGRLFWSTDAGCSCPSPFDTCHSLEDLEPLTLDTWAEFEGVVKEHCEPYQWSGESDEAYITRRNGSYGYSAFQVEKTDLLRKASAILAGAPHAVDCRCFDHDEAES